MRYNHCIIVRSYFENKMVGEVKYSAETSLNFIKAKIKEENSDLRYEIVCRSDFIIEEINVG